MTDDIVTRLRAWTIAFTWDWSLPNDAADEIERLRLIIESLDGFMTFDEWAKYGWKQGWCGPPLCLTHDGFPMSDEELGEFDEGNDACMHFVRLYEDETHQEAIEESDSPTNWRASNMGWKRA